LHPLQGLKKRRIGINGCLVTVKEDLIGKGLVEFNEDLVLTSLKEIFDDLLSAEAQGILSQSEVKP
jgi:hypothetical protein